jgi:drug/metabolite transporter (DMT)-like permease
MISLAPALADRVPRRAVGVALAFTTAIVSGVSIYVNGHAVKHFGDATVYTTAKNAVAGALLLIVALVALAPGATSRNASRTRPATLRQWLALLAVAVVGGSVPFVLFFEGLARAEATQAAFLHKTLVVWVALLAVPLLRERVGAAHALAVGLLVAGQAWIAGDAGTVVFGAGEAMILAATLLWAVEVVFVKHLLSSLVPPSTLAAARMGIGTLILVGWVAVSGKAGDLAGLGAEQWQWALLTGSLLTAYVATWYAALARAQAVDVTAVLVFGAVVTALLSGAADGLPVDAVGTALVAAGSALAAFLAVRHYGAEAVSR